MKLSRRTETVLGLALAAALAAAVVAVRQRQSAPRGPVPAAPEDAPAAGLADVTDADATLDLGEVRVVVSAAPRPLLAFARNRFRFRAEKDGSPVVLADAVVSFTMAMPMGDHRHALVAAGDGWQEAEAVLPLCPSGRRRWFGTLDFTLAGQPRSAFFAFDLAPPPRRPGDAAATPRP